MCSGPEMHFSEMQPRLLTCQCKGMSQWVPFGRVILMAVSSRKSNVAASGEGKSNMICARVSVRLMLRVAEMYPV